MRYLILLILCGTVLAQLPDAPSTSKSKNTWRVLQQEPYHTPFLKGRRYTDPPLRTNKEIFHSKSFILLQIGIWGSVSANLARNWNNYKHNQPHGGELLVDALVPSAINSVMVWGSYKYLWAPIGVGTASYGIVVNTRSAVDKVYY